MREYKIVRNKVRKESRKLDKLHQSQIAKSCKNNPKCFWKHVLEKNWFIVEYLISRSTRVVPRQSYVRI